MRRFLIALAALATSACAGASTSGGASSTANTNTTRVAVTESPSDPVVAAAEPYAAYRADVAAIRATELDSLGDLEGVLERAARHNRVALQRGWIAYGALHAAQSRAFRAGLTRAVRRDGRSGVMNALLTDPSYAAAQPGYRDALALVYASSAADMSVAETAARQLEAQASAASNWPNRSATARADRLRRLGDARFVSRPELRPLSLEATPPGRAPRVTPAREAIARRMTALAAMHILDADRAEVERVLDDAPTQSCLRMANLQFYQCVSVTHTPDEAAYCLSRHALREVSGCMSFAPAT